MVKKDLDENEDDLSEDHDDEDEDVEEGGWSFRKKFFTMIIAIILIIAAISAVFLLNPNVQQVIVLPPNQLDDNSGIRVEAQSLLEGSGSANGEGKLKILYNGEIQYSTKLKFSGDQAIKVIKYNEFFVDRGEYELLASFGGKTSDSYFFDPEEDFSFGIADHLNITLALEPDNFEIQNSPSIRDDPINIHALVYVRELKTSGGVTEERNPRAPPTNTELEITIEHESGFSANYSTTLEEAATATFDQFLYKSSSSGPGAGYYTVSAKLTNNYVKPDSPKYKVELDSITTQYLNVQPIAVHDSDITDSTNQATIDIEFDASESWNDGDIVKYVWDYEMEEDNKGNLIFEADEETTTSNPTHTYTRTSPLPPSSDIFTVGLMIIGDAKDPGFGTDNVGNTNNEHSTLTDITVTITWTRF